MTAEITEIYRKNAPLIATYDFADIEEGSGYVNYYAFNQQTSGSTVYKLGRQQVYSNNVMLSGVSTTSTSNFLSGSFDLAFSLPRVIDGAIRANIPYTHFGGGSPVGMVFLNLKKVVDGVETEIGSVASEEFSGSTRSKRIINMEIDVVRTKFIPGDILRAQILVQGTSNPASTHNVGIDPKNRSFGAQLQVGSTIDTTTTTLQVPFVIDVS